MHINSHGYATALRGRHNGTVDEDGLVRLIEFLGEQCLLPTLPMLPGIWLLKRGLFCHSCCYFLPSYQLSCYQFLYTCYCYISSNRLLHTKHHVLSRSSIQSEARVQALMKCKYFSFITSSKHAVLYTCKSSP